MRKLAFLSTLLLGAACATAARPGDVIINEFYWHTTGGGEGHFEGVELLVVNDKVDLNNVVITDRDTFDAPTGEDRAVLNDGGTGALAAIPKGTLVVVYGGAGKDDVDPSDGVIRLYAQSSKLCDARPTGYPFKLNDEGDNLHLFQVGGEQLDYLRYKASDKSPKGKPDAGAQKWGNGSADAAIDVGAFRVNADTRYTGDTADGNNDPASWVSTNKTTLVDDNLGKPNGGKNTEWIARLRGVTVASLGGPASAATAQTARKGDQNVRQAISDPDQVIVQAHRGAGDLAEENTVRAFELGWKLGCYAECDVRTTKDGVIVTFHDADFKRVVKNVPPDLADKGVVDVTWDQLSKLDVGSWKGDSFEGRRVSKISEAFAAMSGHPDRHLYLDIKNVDLAKLAGEVKAAGVGPQVILASTKYDVIREWKRLLPDSKTLLWMGGTEAALEKRFVELRKTDFADVTQLQVHVRLKQDLNSIGPDSVNPFEPSDDFLVRAGKEVRSHGILYQSLPWGGTTKGVYWKLLDLGVMSFATDRPDVTREAIREYYRRGAMGSK
jgi:glycerophosphoryl diester phosphodiesterase